jgi:hypothetical protein
LVDRGCIEDPKWKRTRSVGCLRIELGFLRNSSRIRSCKLQKLLGESVCWSGWILEEAASELASPSNSQTQDPKTKVDLTRKIILSGSVELLVVIAQKEPTWRASCRCLTTDNLPWGYLGQLFGLRRSQNSTVNAEDSRFILVQALVIE